MISIIRPSPYESSSERVNWVGEAMNHMQLEWQTFDSLSANPTKWSNTLKKFVGNSRRIVLSLFDHFVGLALKGLNSNKKLNTNMWAKVAYV